MPKKHNKPNTHSVCATDFSVCWEAILEKLKIDLIRPMLTSQIGKVIVNLDKTKQDLTSWNDGTFEYTLCNGAKIDANTHPELAVIYGEYVPDFSTGSTVRHIPEGDSRILGDYQADDIKAHIHKLTSLKGSFRIFSPDTVVPTGVFSSTEDHNAAPVGDGGWDSKVYEISFNKDNTYFTEASGNNETCMKNIAVQIYVISKVLI